MTTSVPGAPAQDAPAGERAKSSGTWKIGAWDPRVVKVLTLLAFALPVVAYVAMLVHYQVNTIVADQWNDVDLIRDNFAHFPDWSSLWSPHTNNRIFFPNLIVVGLAHTVDFNIDVEEWLSALLLFAATALLIWCHKLRSPDTPLLFYCPVVFLTLTFAQWQNTLWGFQMAWYLVVLALAVSLVFLDRSKLTWPVFVLAALAGVVGSYSSLQGLLIWPAGLVLLYHRRRQIWAIVAWIAIAITTTVFGYWFDFHNGSSANSYASAHPFQDIKFFLYALGDIVGAPLGFGAHADGPVMAFGLIVFVVAVFVLVKWGIPRDERSGAPIGIALIVFGFLFVAVITEGRVIFTPYAADPSRYTTNDVLVLAGTYMVALNGPLDPIHASLRRRTTSLTGTSARAWTFLRHIDRTLVRGVTLALIVVQVVFSVHYGLQGARQDHQEDQVIVAVTRNVDHEPNAIIEWYFGAVLLNPPDWFRVRVHFLQEHHLSLFAGPPPRRVVQPPPTAQPRPTQPPQPGPPRPGPPRPGPPRPTCTWSSPVTHFGLSPPGTWETPSAISSCSR